jgi:hypothetical protein
MISSTLSNLVLTNSHSSTVQSPNYQALGFYKSICFPQPFTLNPKPSPSCKSSHLSPHFTRFHPYPPKPPPPIMCPFQSPASSLQRPSVYLPDTSASPFCSGFALNGQTQEKKKGGLYGYC